MSTALYVYDLAGVDGFLLLFCLGYASSLSNTATQWPFMGDLIFSDPVDWTVFVSAVLILATLIQCNCQEPVFNLSATAPPAGKYTTWARPGSLAAKASLALRSESRSAAGCNEQNGTRDSTCPHPKNTRLCRKTHFL